MANLEALLNDLANLDAQHDLEGMRRVRQEIVLGFPDSDAAVEALYKIGLDLLFRHRDLLAAIESFGEAAKRKHPFWSAAARTSLGLCLYHQGRTQKALFELRRVAYPDKPSVHSVTALAFIESIMAKEGSRDEVKKVQKERIGQLEKLVLANEEQGGDAAERGHHLYQLGLARLDAGDDKGGKRALDEAKALGPQVLGAELYRSVADVLGR
jgi:tetratricopeptide (TPR) repeat protein